MAFEAAVRRHQLFWFRNHLISVDQTPNNPNYHTVTVYEPRNKFIAFTASFQKVTNLAFEWGNIYVIQADGKVCGIILLSAELIDLLDLPNVRERHSNEARDFVQKEFVYHRY